MINSIAVFPFEMIKGDVADEWLKDHFSESLTFQLGSMKNIKIIDRLQIRKAINKYEKPKQAGIAELATEIGKDIGANLVLLGNYSIIDNEILIITKIVNSKTGETTPLIKKQYNLDAKSAAFDIANDLSEKIFNHLQEDKTKNSR
jgi:TolB-like protein